MEPLIVHTSVVTKTKEFDMKLMKEKNKNLNCSSKTFRDGLHSNMQVALNYLCMYRY